MSFTYDANLTTHKDLIRFKLGDTVDTNHYLEDEEITAILLEEQIFKNALLECCEAIIALLSKKVTYKIGPESVNLSDAHKHYVELLATFKVKYAKSIGVPSASISAPQFSIGMHDYV